MPLIATQKRKDASASVSFLFLGTSRTKFERDLLEVVVELLARDFKMPAIYMGTSLIRNCPPPTTSPGRWLKLWSGV